MAEDKTKGIGFEQSSNSGLPKGKNYLLAIGIDQYKDFLKLNNAVKDVRDISALLLDKYEFQAANITLLTDEKATRKNIIKALKNLCTKATADDKILIYYSGHGFLDEITERGFWIPVDAEKEDESSYVSNANLRDYIKAMKSRHTLLISDSCFSGALMARDATRDISGAFDTWEESKSRYVFSSGKGIVSDGKANENSPFAKAILKQLKNLSDSRINIVRLADDVTRHVRFNYDQQAEISPLFDTGHDGGQFVFHLKKDETSDWKEAQTLGTIAAFQTFLAKYPDGKNAVAATAKIQSLKSEALWQEIQTAPYDDTSQISTRLRLVDKYVNNYESEQRYIECVNIARFLKYKKKYLFAKNDEHELRIFLTKHVPDLEEARAIKIQAQADLAVIKNKEKAKDEERVETERQRLEQEAQQRAEKERLEQEQAAAKLKKEQATAKKRADEEAQRKAKAAADKKEQERIAAQKIVQQQQVAEDPKPNLSLLQQYGKFLPLLLLLPLAICFFSSGDEKTPSTQATVVEQSKIEDKPSRIINKDPVEPTKNNDEKEKKPVEKPIVPQIAALELSYRWGKDEIKATFEGGKAPYALLLKKGNKTKYSESYKKIGSYSIPITAAYRKDAGTYKLIVEDARGKTTSKDLTIDAPKPTSPPASPSAGKSGSFTDSRDGHTYTYVTLKDGKKWMSQNLNYKSSDSWYHEKVTSSSDKNKYGRLYTWADAKKACPNGWRLPSDKEWRAMAKHYGGCDDDAKDGGKAAYKVLIFSGSTGLSAQLGGGRTSNGSFDYFGNDGYYWSSTEYDAGSAWRYRFYQPNTCLRRYYYYKSWGFSCRCLKD